MDNSATIFGILLFIGYIAFRVWLVRGRAETLRSSISENLDEVFGIVRESRSDPKVVGDLAERVTVAQLRTLEQRRRVRLERLHAVVKKGTPLLTNRGDYGLERKYDRFIDAVWKELRVPVQQHDATLVTKTDQALERLLNNQ